MCEGGVCVWGGGGWMYTWGVCGGERGTRERMAGNVRACLPILTADGAS